MAYVNIPRHRDDPNYRYKMPRLYSKIEGRGNGIKTNISNMGEIAKALKRPPMYPTKFFGCELGAQCKYEEAQEKSLVNGQHTEKDLVDILDKFIAMYVLCPSCQLPEMDLVVKKGVLTSKCNACGNQSVLDMTHKAATYMVKNPPDQTASTVGPKKKSKEDRKAGKATKRGDTLEDEGDEAPVDTPLEKKKKDKKDKKKKEKDEKSEKKPKKNKSREMSEDDDEPADQTPSESDRIPLPADTIERLDSDEVEAGDDSTKRKKKKRSKGEPGETLQFNEKLSFTSAELDDVVERLRVFLYSCAQNQTKATPHELFTEVRLLQVAQDFDSKVRMYVVLRALFGETLTADDFEAKVPFIKNLMDSSCKGTDLFEALEYFVNEVCDEKLLTDYPYIVQKIYKNLLLESDDILRHYRREEGDANFLKCKKAAEPVLVWLDENDSEEEDSETEDESP